MLSRILYIAVLIACTVFFVLYKDSLALLLLCVVAAVPFAAFITALLKRLCVRIRADKINSAVYCGNTASIAVNVKNKLFLPIERIILNVSCENRFLDVKTDCKTSLGTSALGSETANLQIASEHIGKMNVTVESAVISDALNLFRFRKGIDSTSTIAFLPPLHSMDVKLRSNAYMSGDADTYSKNKPGDDPSEVFDIREYRDGDKLNRIHWKLTVKQNQYMVREFSLPLNENILLYVDLTVDSLKNIDYDSLDRAFSEMFSAAMTLMAQKRQFAVCWYDIKTKRFLSEPIKSDGELYSCMDEIFSSKLNVESVSLSAPEIQDCCSHICIFSSRDSECARALLESVQNQRIVKSAVCRGETAEKIAAGDMYIYKYDSESCVSEIEI